MNSNLPVLIKKYAVPVIFTVIGLVIIFFGLKTNQDMLFNLASVFMFAAAILSVMYSSGKFKTIIINVLGIVAGIAAMATIYLSFKTVADSQEFIKNHDLSKLKAEQNLTDIRYIQKRHAEEFGKYAENWDAFETYAKNATMDYVDAAGTVPGRKLTQEESRFIYKDNRPTDNLMTETEAYVLSKSEMCPVDLKGFRRDTTKVNLIKTKFQSASYVDNRLINNLGRFSLDSLRYVPFTGMREQWVLETRDSVMVGDEKLPALKVTGKLPFPSVEGGKREEISFGSTTSNDLGGSWE